MTFQDAKYITAIIKAGSINQAANELLVSQPSLSKCIQKLEAEYSIRIFERSRGSKLKLTAEGCLFRDMAEEILSSHEHFEDRLKRLRLTNSNVIVFGLTHQRSFSVVSPLLDKLYLEDPDLLVQVQVTNSDGLYRGLQDGSIDMALLGMLTRNDDLYYFPITTSIMAVYLRRDSPVKEKAVHIDGYNLPALKLEDLADEVVAVSSRGSFSRANVDMLLEQASVTLKTIELPIYQNRLSAVESGKCDMMIPINPSDVFKGLSKDRLYYIHPSQNITTELCLVCREGDQNSRKFQLIKKCILSITGKNSN